MAGFVDEHPLCSGLLSCQLPQATVSPGTISICRFIIFGAREGTYLEPGLVAFVLCVGSVVVANLLSLPLSAELLASQ